jgi:DNA-binding transcriptional regulator LsrR (DeoR family)
MSLMRRRQAWALYEEGMTMAQLGRLLGVTRQRIAVLLEEKRKKT